MLVTLITATGDRHVAFRLCEKYMGRQTYTGDIQWIVVDDCEPATVCTMDQEYIRGPKLWHKGMNTQRINLDLALQYVKGDYVFIIEDDDWYAPNYLEVMLNLLQYYPVVGEGNARYYNIQHRCWRSWSNMEHASLCQTAVAKEALPLLEDAINSGELYIDIVVWKRAIEQQIPCLLFMLQNLCLGIKGMPGRGGIGMGHKPHERDFIADPLFEKLKEMLGESDAHAYTNLNLFIAKNAAKVVDKQ